VLEHVGNRPTADPVFQIDQCSLNTRVSPASILLRHAYDQLRDVTHDGRPPYPSSLSKVPLLRNQPPMPSQEGIRRDDGVELEQSLSPYRLGLARQKSQLTVGEADTPPAQPLFEQSVFSLKKFDDDELMAMNPPSSNHQRK